MTHEPGTDAELAEWWVEHRRYLIDLAFRMLGSISDAEDIVQEAFVRLLRADTAAIEDVRGWLVVVVSRLCLDHLRSARVRHEGTADPSNVEAPARPGSDPADRVTLDEHVSVALLVVLQRLSPAERAVFVLHDVFQFPFDEVGSIVGRSPAACRQLATRARRHVAEQTDAARFHVDPAEQQRVAERFINACAGGDLEALMQVLDADVAGDFDGGPDGPKNVLVGRQRVAAGLQRFFGPGSGTVLVSHPVNGAPGVFAFREAKLFAVMSLRAPGGIVDHIHAIGDPAQLDLIESQLAGRAGLRD